MPVFVDDAVAERYRQHQESSTAIAIQNREYHPLWPYPARRVFLSWLAEYLVQRKLSRPGSRAGLAAGAERLSLSSAVRLYDRAQIPGLRDEGIDSLYRTGIEKSDRMGLINFGDLRWLEPVSRQFGLERGLPIDRYYIEKFLAQHAVDIRGRVLEIGDDSYTRWFGGARVHTRDVLHVNAGIRLQRSLGIWRRRPYSLQRF